MEWPAQSVPKFRNLFVSVCFLSVGTGAMAAATKITLKLLIDKEKNRVVLAESEHDFVDILFSFLTLPMGTIVRLLGKQSNIGCFDKLYESGENLDSKHLQTEACKTMLLWPISAAEELGEYLTIQVDDTVPRRAFCCKHWNVSSKDCLWWSRVQNTRCKCGKMMDIELTIKKRELGGNGVFVKQAVMFMISDDLRIMPLSTGAGKFMLHISGVSRETVFEEQIVEFGRDEVLNLLKCSLQSSTPLSDVFLRRSDLHRVVKLELEDQIQVAHIKQEVEMEHGIISVKLFQSKSDKKVLYGEAGEEFVDLLFSLLVLPLGSIVEYLSGNANMGSIDNLYKSVEDLNVSGCMVSEDRKVMLLSPKLPPYSGCDNLLIKTTEKISTYEVSGKRCASCDKLDDNTYCCASKKIETVALRLTNPKNRDPAEKSGGRYVTKRSNKYMVTEELLVKPLSFISIMDTDDHLKKHMFDVEEKKVCIGEGEVRALLRATLTTRSALSSAFSPKNKKKCRYL